MKQTLTILTCSAAILGAIAMTQVSMSGSAARGIDVRSTAAGETETAPSAAQDGTNGPRHRSNQAEALFDDLMRSDRASSLTPELVDQALAIAHEIDSELGDRLKAMCGEDPDEFERVLRTTGRRLIGLAELKNDAPELYDMKRREWRQEVLISRTTRELAEAKISGDNLRIRMLENELRSHISIQVALNIAIRGEYVRRLQEHVRALEREVDHQASNFEQTVTQRYQSILERAERESASNGDGDIQFINHNE